MNLRYDNGWNPPHSAYVGDGPIPTWDINSVPDFYRYADEALEHSQKWQNSGTTFIELLKGIGGSVPFIGNLFNAVGNIALNAWHRGDVNIANSRRRLESRYADWYNSPVQQLKRARIAGINPFMQNYVKSLPHEVPQVETVPNQGFSLNTESLAGLINAFTNANVAESRIHNLDSLTAINEYKENFLYPQLYEANGYANSISQLQVAWEEKNYDFERLLKQQILQVQYENSLIETGKGLMEVLTPIPGSFVRVDPVAGTLLVQVPDDEGNKIDYELSQLPFDKLPPFLQKKLTDIWSTRQLTDSKTQLNTIIGNTQSALGGLYNANRQKVDIYCNEYEKTGLWPDSDAFLRAAAGSIPWSYINKAQANQLGWDAANAAVGLGADATKILLNHGVGSFFGMKKGAYLQSVKDAGRYRLPKGASPYINADWNSYSSPYNYNFIY